MRQILSTALVAGVIALGAAPALAGNQDFTLVNRTGYQIDEVYVSSAANRNWGNDVMGSDSLPNGSTVNITFDAPANVCRWDMKVKYNDGDEATWSGLNLCNISKVTLFWDRSNQTTRAVTE